MVTAHPTTEHDVREAFARYLGAVPVARRLWARGDRDHATFWLLTDPITPEEARALFRANAYIYEHVPDARFDFLVVNPTMFDEPDFTFDPPHGAEEIPLRE